MFEVDYSSNKLIVVHRAGCRHRSQGKPRQPLSAQTLPDALIEARYQGLAPSEAADLGDTGAAPCVVSEPVPAPMLSEPKPVADESRGYRIEIRFNFHGPADAMWTQARAAAQHVGGEVTAVFDTETWEEVDG